MSNHYTAKVAESLKLRGWIDEIQAKALRADNARLKGEVEACRSEVKKFVEVSDFNIRERVKLRDQLATYKAAVVEAREALQLIRDTECELEHSEDCVCCLSDSPTKTIADQSLHTLSALTCDATKTT